MKRFLCYIIFGLLVNSSSVYLYANNPQQEAQEILSGKLSSENFRYITFEKVLTLMKERNVKTIVETGTTRGVLLQDIFAGDGGGTILFSEYALRNDARVYSVDILQEAFENAAHFLTPYEGFIFTVCDDSVNFIKNFNSTIDMLYLDSYDFDINDPSPSQVHHLNEIIAAYPLLTSRSIVMIDDCGLPWGGKGALAIQYLQEQGWKTLIQAYQVILIKE
ncbi:MAG: class I SAM-dependent methyltransferase [Parachlamydiaceae bacterium]|nr:class I SAM-dependent methyltransferase [Parachlamydiaceae bacterium]